MNRKNYGFRPENIVIESDHYHLGATRSLPTEIIRPDRRWSPFVPDYEAQAPIFETDGCTVWGTQNCVEVLDRAIFGDKSNYAERFNYILGDVSPDGGGDPHAVAESIRTQGLVDQLELPMTETLDEFVQPNPMTEWYLAKGRKWLNHKAFGHEWVFTGGRSREVRTDLIRQALLYSPLGVSVSAWETGPDGTYVDGGRPNNHWVCLLEETPRGWLIFDSYDTGFKVLSFDHDIQFCKRYSLSAVKSPVGGCFLSRIFTKHE